MGLGALNSEGKAWVFPTWRPAQGLACRACWDRVCDSQRGFSTRWTHSAHVACLRLKETLIWGGGALPLGPLLLSDLREEEREGPGTWGDRPRLLLPGCPAVF